MTLRRGRGPFPYNLVVPVAQNGSSDFEAIVMLLHLQRCVQCAEQMDVERFSRAALDFTFYLHAERGGGLVVALGTREKPAVCRFIEAEGALYTHDGRCGQFVG